MRNESFSRRNDSGGPKFTSSCSVKSDHAGQTTTVIVEGVAIGMETENILEQCRVKATEGKGGNPAEYRSNNAWFTAEMQEEYYNRLDELAQERATKFNQGASISFLQEAPKTAREAKHFFELIQKYAPNCTLDYRWNSTSANQGIMIVFNKKVLGSPRAHRLLPELDGRGTLTEFCIKGRPVKFINVHLPYTKDQEQIQAVAAAIKQLMTPNRRCIGYKQELIFRAGDHNGNKSIYPDLVAGGFGQATSIAHKGRAGLYSITDGRDGNVKQYDGFAASDNRQMIVESDGSFDINGVYTPSGRSNLPRLPEIKRGQQGLIQFIFNDKTQAEYFSKLLHDCKIASDTRYGVPKLVDDSMSYAGKYIYKLTVEECRAMINKGGFLAPEKEKEASDLITPLCTRLMQSITPSVKTQCFVATTAIGAYYAAGIATTAVAPYIALAIGVNASIIAINNMYCSRSQQQQGDGHAKQH